MSQVLVVGSVNMDLIISSCRFPSAGETVLGGDLRMVPGGKGANQAYAAARLGATTRIIAQIGQDAFGEQVTASLYAAGVETSLIGTADRSTGTAMINVRSDGENTILLAPGANATLDPATVLERLPLLNRGDLVLLQLEIPVITVEVIAKRAHDSGAIVILDPAPFQPLPASLLRQVDFITPNRAEAAAMGARREHSKAAIESPSSLARELRLQGPAIVILKLGANGCFISTPSFEQHVEPFAVETVDTTAAGDVFNAAFAVALSEGALLVDAARFANAAAALSTTKVGAQSSIPSRVEVDVFLDARRNGPTPVKEAP